MTRLILLTFPGNERLASGLARSLGVEATPIDLHQFPDGETLVTLSPGIAGRNVAILAGLRDPNPMALPLRFAAETARELGARRVGLIAPYLAYMRQDRRFAPGQAVSARLFAGFLAESFDWLATVDPHLHRIPTLEALLPIPALNVHAAPAIADWIAANVADAVLLGPDSESQQWVEQVARLAGRPCEVLRKTRRGDFQVDLTLPESPELGRGTPVVLDDIASTGRTMAQAVRHLIEAGFRAPVCVVIHAVFAGDAEAEIRAAGAAEIVSTDTIEHSTNRITVAPALASGIARFNSEALDLPVAGISISGQARNENGQDQE